jgi:hypothetical protein
LRPNNQPDLDASLEAYAAAAQTAADSRSWSERLGSWPVYAAAAGSALALGTSAAASIIYSGIQNVIVSVTATNIGYRYDTDYITVGAFSAYPYFRAFHSNFPSVRVGGVGVTASCICGTQFFGGPYNLSVSNFPLKNLAFGQTISDGLVAGSTQLNSRGFLAFRYELNSCTPSDPTCIAPPPIDLQPFGASNDTGIAGFKTFAGNFGWIRLKWNASNGFPNSITIVDWAIEDSGAPILAGADGIPEPGTMSMTLLAAGAAGILAWRKRKNAAAAPPQA